MFDTPAVVGAGRYLPPFVLATARRPVRVGNGDEDAITLAIEAAQDCLSRHCPSEIDVVHLALSRPEPAGGPQADVLREALGLDRATAVALSAGDALAGVSALLAAMDAVAAGRCRAVLVVAAEPGDGVRVSAGAVALLIARTAGPALRVSVERSHGDVVHVSADGRYLAHRAGELVRACGADPDAVLAEPGVAGPLLALLRGPGQVLATSESRVIALQASLDPGTTPLLPPTEDLDARLTEPTEIRTSPPLSLPGSSPFFQRSARELLRLEGARCRTCEHVVFPPSQRPICSACHGAEFDPVAIARTGVVHTYVVNRFLPTGFGTEMALVLADLDDGNRYWAPTSGIRTEDLAIGTEVELRLRRFSDHGGAPTYAMKFVPRRRMAAA